MHSIQKSIQRHQRVIMDDINASARVISQGKEDKTYITRIIDWNDRDITFHAPLILGDYVRLLRNKIYPFVIVTRGCVYMTSVKISSFARNKQGHFYYRGIISSPLERNQQRQYFRLDWAEPFKFSTGQSSDMEKGSTIDISAGGLRMACEKRLTIDDSIHIEITLLDRALTLEGIIIDELEKNLADLYVYRVQFHELSQATQNQLAQLIMLRQRQMIKRQ